MTYEVADVFSTYVYRKGLLESNYSYGRGLVRSRGCHDIAAVLQLLQQAAGR